MSLNKKKILIMGGSGFIGQNLTNFFSRQKDYEVHATYFSRMPSKLPNVTFHYCDLRDQNQCSEVLQGMDILVQAAATTSGAKDIVNSPSLHVTDNAVMNSYIMKTATELNLEHVVFFSCTVMYPSDEGRALTEDDFNPEKVFPRYFGVAWTKVYIEKICEFFSKQSQTKFTVLRHSNIYGPHDKYDSEKSHVFGATVNKVMKATDEVVVWGDGKETRDLLYVDDLINFVDLALKKQTSAYELVNVGYGESISVLELVQKIIHKSAKVLKITLDNEKPSIPTNIKIDITKAQRLYNWTPLITLDDGIEKTLEWYKENIPQ